MGNEFQDHLSKQAEQITKDYIPETFGEVQSLVNHVKSKVKILQTTDDHKIHFATSVKLEMTITANRNLDPFIDTQVTRMYHHDPMVDDDYTIVDLIDDILSMEV